MTYATPLRLELGPSRQAACWLAAVHAAALACLPLLSLPSWVRLLLLLLLIRSLLLGWTRYVTRRHPEAVNRLLWATGNVCELVTASGSVRSCSLSHGAFILPWLVILYFGPGCRQSAVVILPDMLPAETLRRLRVRLRTDACDLAQCT